MRIDLQTAIDVLATRYDSSRIYDGRSKSNNTCIWNRKGRSCITNLNVLDRYTIRRVSNLMNENFGRRKSPWPIRHIDMHKALPRLWVFHRSLSVRHINWLVKRMSQWHRWPSRRLPMLVFYDNDVIVWNGTHRTVLSLLTGRKLRARCVDMNSYLRWKKIHYPKWKKAKGRR